MFCQSLKVEMRVKNRLVTSTQLNRLASTIVTRRFPQRIIYVAQWMLENVFYLENNQVPMKYKIRKNTWTSYECTALDVLHKIMGAITVAVKYKI